MAQVRSWWRILMLLMTVLDCVLDLNLKNPQQLFSAIGGQVWIPAYTGLKPESGVLECSFRKPNITKEDVIILCNIGSSGCVSSPYKGRLDIFLSNFTLHLKNVREEDSGTYKCALKRPNSTSVITSSYLQVHDTISDLRVIYTYEKSRNTATFLCEFSGDYENITWKKDGKIVFSDLWPVNVKSLIIRKVDTSDSGRYSCIVGTRFGSFKNESEFKLPFSDLKMYMFGLDVSSLTLSCLCFLCILYVSCIPEDATIIIIRKAGFVTYKLFSVINVALFIFMLALWNTQGSLVAASMMVPFTIGFVPVLACLIMDFCTCTKCTENELFLGVADISPHVMNLVILFGSITAICELSTREFGDPHPAWILSVFGTVGIFLCVSLGVYRCCIYCRDRPRPKTSDQKEQVEMMPGETSPAG